MAQKVRLIGRILKSPRHAPRSFHQVIRYGGQSYPCGERVKISQPLSVTPMVCSNWADKERSRVTAVQPSDSTFTSGLPELIIGSMVKNIPGFNMIPSPGRP